MKFYYAYLTTLIKESFRYWPVIVFAILAILTILASNITIGKPKSLEAKIIDIGVTQGAAGNSLFFVGKSENGQTIRISNGSAQYQIGDVVPVLSYDRLLFSNVYTIDESK